VNESAIVYVALTGEGVDVWRPVRAERVSHNTYLLVGKRPEGENWEFDSGDVVVCHPKTLDGEMSLVATSKQK
jgi:hypothetical protein